MGSKNHQIPISSDVPCHILQHQDKNILCKFEHDFAAQWTSKNLQLIKFFELEMGGMDPFNIAGQDEILA